MVEVPVVEFGVAVVVQGVVLLVVEVVPVVVPVVVLGDVEEEGVVPVPLQSVLGALPVLVEDEGVVEEDDGVVEVEDDGVTVELLPSLGVVPIVDPVFCVLLGVVPAAVPMPFVEVPVVAVLGLV